MALRKMSIMGGTFSSEHLHWAVVDKCVFWCEFWFFYACSGPFHRFIKHGQKDTLGLLSTLYGCRARFNCSWDVIFEDIVTHCAALHAGCREAACSAHDASAAMAASHIAGFPVTPDASTYTYYNVLLHESALDLGNDCC